MRIAIHNNESDITKQWINYCTENSIDYKIVNSYDSSVIDELIDCDAFMWHHHHGDYRDVNFAKELLASVEAMGKIVFPNHSTGWYFDDKVGEKYLLEALKIPTIASYTFYEKNKAIRWAQETTYPKVFKLRGGAGAMNVVLVRNKKMAKSLINKAFGSGFKAFRPYDYFKERYNKWKVGKDTLIGVVKALGRFIVKPKGTDLLPTQKGYVYFQDFIPDNKFDTRVVVIFCKYAFAERRFVRKNDFRASGSGIFDYSEIDEEIIKAAFDAAKKIKAQSIAFDFIFNSERQPLVVEMSYAFGTHGISHAPVYWTDDMICHKNNFESIGGLMIECLLKSNA